MASKYFGILAFANGLLIATAVFAASITTTVTTFPDNGALIQRLEDQGVSDEYNARFWSQEPTIQQDYYTQAKEDRQLIAKIEASLPVSPVELEQALRRVDTDY
jgi:hypothetical protein